MVHSIELRVPFLDHLLYATVLPYLDDAYYKNFPKKMLVEVIGNIPDEIIHRLKMGFTFPFEDWIKTGQLKNFMDLLKTNNNLSNTLNIDHSARTLCFLYPLSFIFYTLYLILYPYVGESIYSLTPDYISLKEQLTNL